jgi:hypothetical protein
MPEYDIDLDLAPKFRFQNIAPHFALALKDFINLLHAKNPVIKLVAQLISDRRGKEPDEMQQEMRAWAEFAGATEAEIHFVNMLYELQTLMVPIVNFSGHPHQPDIENIVDMLGSATQEKTAAAEDAVFPIRFGCTGIIATDDNDGTVYHARNQDFSLAPYIQPLQYTGIFKKNGTEVFRAQMIAGFSSVLTGMRKGPDGYTMEIQTRYTDHVGGNKELLTNLFRNKEGGNKADISGWTKRKILENIDKYDDAVEAFSTSPYVGTEFNIVAGVKKGVILARNPDGLAYKLPLNESEKKYIIITNFDYVYHDIRENFDPSAVKGRYRRQGAEKILDQAKVATPELLFSVINDDHVMAKDTIFQVIMNVETGLWNASMPDCQACNHTAHASFVV